MTERPPPVFLERRSYRRRRIIDAIRVLPLFGTALFVLPLLWPTAQREEATGIPAVAMSDILVYIFGAWALLIAAIVGLSYLERSLSDDADDTLDDWPDPSRPESTDPRAEREAI
ncbi:hypothetical protein [Chachezhania antarctica]|uniref:hypothetical protein n=1 Tax=Chachezhania antarctica TaxID=2340860 RepID=UPI001969271D|nr:hypothetical protein [Chachezhania antarctica]|tara:strand:- start:3727 stop:4071 length:345 start_codon:yes stop_codon:yes gene_type:complete